MAFAFQRCRASGEAWHLSQLEITEGKMENLNIDDVTQDEIVEAEVASELEEAKSFVSSLDLEDVKNGQWFNALWQKVVQSYDHNARAEFFQHKYPGLPPDEIADKLIYVAVTYATIAGAITGTAAAASYISVLGTVGASLAVTFGAIGLEMVFLARIQMQLILELSVVYDLQLDQDDPEDMLMIFCYAMGVAPVEMVGKGLQMVAPRIGIRILQKSILKNVIPFVSAGLGSSYNYVTTKSIGGIAKNQLKNRGKVTEELRQLVSRQNTYEIAFPAAAMYMAQIDGEYSDKENEFYKAILSRMSFDEHTQAEFNRLMVDEGKIIQAVAHIDDDEIGSSLVEVIALMAIYDGELAEKERDFLIKVAAELNVPLDINEVERRTEDYRVVIEKNVLQKAAGNTKEGVAKAAVIAGQAAGNTKENVAKAADIAGQAAGNVKGAAATAGGKVSGAFGNILRRKKDKGSNPETDASFVICVNCKNEVALGYKFCPACGQSMAM